MKINLAMIVKNEERSLERCLRAAAPFVDEIIVVDTGSSDATRAVLLRMQEELPLSLRIFDFAWCGDFSAARNFSLDCSERAGADYHLVLDADEYLLEDIPDRERGKAPGGISGKRLREELLAIETQYGREWIGAIQRTDLFRSGNGSGEEKDSSVSLLLRFLPAGVRYLGRIHEQPDCSFPRLELPLSALHDGYLQEGKGERNLLYLQKALSEHPEDDYFHYQMAVTLRNLNRTEEAMGFFRSFLSLVGEREFERPYRKDGLILCLYTLLDLNTEDSLSEAWDIIGTVEGTEAWGAFSESPDYHFVKGLFYMKRILSDVNRYAPLLPRIEESFLRCLSLGEEGRRDGVRGTGSFKAAYNLGLWYELNGEAKKALRYYETAEEHYAPAGERARLLRGE